MLFQMDGIKNLFKNKHVVIMGDSIQRCIYKDLVLALQEDQTLLTNKDLKAKGEKSFCNDEMVFRSEMSNGREYYEIREYMSQDRYYFVQYHFLTRCYDDRVENIIKQFQSLPPDVIIMNSCLWDISRYGSSSEDDYYHNMNVLCKRLREVLPSSTLFLWTTTLPIASHIASGFLLENIQFMSETLRVAILEANYHVAQIVTAYGYDILDMHYYLRALMNHRGKDGTHWDAYANRHMTELICIFLYDSWGIPLPKHTIRRIKETDMKLDLRHFSYEGIPNFVEASKERLENVAFSSDTNGVSTVTRAADQEDQEGQSDDEPGPSSRSDSGSSETSGSPGSSNSDLSSLREKIANIQKMVHQLVPKK